MQLLAGILSLGGAARGEEDVSTTSEAHGGSSW